ncbi:transposase [Paenibacillus sp. GCM10027626]|uniref:transposase n=1 Tax=Paenibacillus sp. GCM10027626 TaxID=3273411 RepID=UPI00362FE924
MRGTLAEQVKATIYQYQLICKITIHKRILWVYLILAVAFCTWELIQYRLDGAVAMGLGLLIIQPIHFIIIRLTLRRVDVSDYRRWGWRFTPPWIGYTPIAYIELALFRKVHRHLLWLGLCAIGVWYPWASKPLMIAMVSWHVWLLLPYIILLYRLRPMRPEGVIKLQEDNLSYYHR